MIFCTWRGSTGCKMQFGGNDQWSNIIGGVELNRRCDNRDVYGMTFTLLTTREGKKMGKTEKRSSLAGPRKNKPVRVLPVLAQHRRL